MRRNVLRELLNAGKPTLGFHVGIPYPGVVEVVGHSGMFDYVEYKGEGSSWDLHDLDNIGRAIDLFPHMSGMMKVEEQTRGFIAQRSLGAGIQNMLFTDCRSADDVRECIRYVRSETPTSGGIHGASGRRAYGYVLDGGSPAWVKALDDTVCCFMIEKKGAMENLEEILSVPGLSMVQFGASDYSISVGQPGGGRGQAFKEIEKKMIRMAHDKGIPARVELGGFESAQPYIDMGVKHFCIGQDLPLIFNWCKRNGEEMRKLLS